jgi:large subunit ribosomal protein L11
MAKEITGFIKLQIKAGQANPAPPVGPALGSKGVNIMDFCKKFNEATAKTPGKLLPVVITVYSDRTFDFVIKTPPAASQILEFLKLTSGSKEPNKNKIGTITKAQVTEIAKIKFKELNCFKLESAESMIAGTARSMGVLVEDK